MKILYLFFLLFIAVQYGVGHYYYYNYKGNQRFYTIYKDDQTYVELNLLKEPVKLIFPDQGITFRQILSDIKLSWAESSSPIKTLHKPLKDWNETDWNLEFELVINAENHIRGVIKVINLVVRQAKMYLYEKCGPVEASDYYAGRRIDEIPQNLENVDGDCFANIDGSIQIYDDRNKLGYTQYGKVIELKVTALPPKCLNKCQTFMILPKYLEVEVDKTKEKTYLPTNTDVREERGYLWRLYPDDYGNLPKAFSYWFDMKVAGVDLAVVGVDMLKSTKDVPIYFLIGIDQPIPSFKFIFGEKCDGATFELFLNLRDSPDCRIGIHLDGDWLEISTKQMAKHYVYDSSRSPTLVFGENQVYVKVESRIFIHEFEVCETSNPSKVLADQMVLHVYLANNVRCDKADIVMSSVPGFQVAINNRVLYDLLYDFSRPKAGRDELGAALVHSKEGL